MKSTNNSAVVQRQAALLFLTGVAATLTKHSSYNFSSMAQTFLLTNPLLTKYLFTLGDILDQGSPNFFFQGPHKSSHNSWRARHLE